MKLKNPLKKEPTPQSAILKNRESVGKPKEKRDYFESGLILGTGLMIGALATYLIIAFKLGA